MDVDFDRKFPLAVFTQSLGFNTSARIDGQRDIDDGTNIDFHGITRQVLQFSRLQVELNLYINPLGE